ncbi:MAG: CLC_0170 family protein [Clostridia bacterium]|jgi:hypothetical protein|nr:hypothetical protein [Clostridiales bacterium]
MEVAVPMEFIGGVFKDIWRDTKALYNIYTMLLGMGIGVFCYFVDGESYGKKGLKREKIAAKLTGLFLFVFAAGLYILVLIF